MTASRYPVGVLGGGAWGTALAAVMAQIHDEVLIWAREPEVVQSINSEHENTMFLPGTQLSQTILATADLAQMANCGALLVVTPAQHVRATLAALPATNVPLLLCAKGIEAETQLLVSDIAAQVRPDNPLAVLSGPTFAHEVAAGKPTAITLATANQALGSRLDAFDSRSAFQALLVGRYCRRRNWRRGQECARHSMRCRRRGRAGAQRTRGIDRARLCRDAALWSRPWRKV